MTAQCSLSKHKRLQSRNPHKQQGKLDICINNTIIPVCTLFLNYVPFYIVVFVCLLYFFLLFISPSSSCQASHEHARVRGVHGGAGDAGHVRRDEAGSRRHHTVHHCPMSESEKPHCPPGRHIPGHSAQSLPA